MAITNSIIEAVNNVLYPSENTQLDLTKIPEHIAIIMDGNRRWAKSKKLPAFMGHSQGAETLTEMVKIALNLKIKVLTVFAFSTENWARSSSEIENLMRLFERYLNKQKKFMQKEGVRLNSIGDLSRLPKKSQKAFFETKQATKDGKNLDLVLAINYGSRDEIKRATLNILKDYDEKKLKKSDITEDLISKYLDTSKYKDPDLLIRTSGENRLSNFLLWQISYSEVYVTDVLWPDFSKHDFYSAILDYQKRKRRLGKE